MESAFHEGSLKTDLIMTEKSNDIDGLNIIHLNDYGSRSEGPNVKYIYQIGAER
jgi:hypothetical protein